MKRHYTTKFVRKLTGATENQLKYWVKIRIVSPQRIGKVHYYSFRDIVKLRVLVDLRRQGLSLQKVRAGIDNLTRILPDAENPMSRLVIHTDGIDMIVMEKGHYFSAITKQQYFSFDTEKIKSEIIQLQTAQDRAVASDDLSRITKETLKKFGT